MEREGDASVRGPASAHYAALAARYDQNWTHSESFIAWMTAQIIDALAVTPATRLADVGCGTGLFTREILTRARPTTPVVCVDPSAEMLTKIPADPGLLPVQASAEDLAGLTATTPPPAAAGPFDAIVVKEAIHHVREDDQPAVIAGLARLLAPAGRLLVVMLPTTIDYPLFDAALQRFTALQPDPNQVADRMRKAGLAVELTYRSTDLAIPRDRYLSMVASRYLSLLSDFDDNQLDAGIREIADKHPEPVYTFPDRFAFVLGTQAGPA